MQNQFVCALNNFKLCYTSGKVFFVQIGNTDSFVKVTKAAFFKTFKTSKATTISGFTLPEFKEYVWITGIRK